MTLAITYQSLDAITPYNGNPRTHSVAQLKQIENSLAKFGWATPLGVADGTLIYGHARRIAAIALRDRGVAIPGHPDPDTAPVVDLSRLSAAERRAYVIADNRLAIAAGWDDALLRAELLDLKGLGFDLSLTGFDTNELMGLLKSKGGAVNPDDIPPTPEVPVSRRGDVWLLGATVECPHCGLTQDAAEAAA